MALSNGPEHNATEIGLALESLRQSATPEGRARSPEENLTPGPSNQPILFTKAPEPVSRTPIPATPPPLKPVTKYQQPGRKSAS